MYCFRGKKEVYSIPCKLYIFGLLCIAGQLSLKAGDLALVIGYVDSAVPGPDGDIVNVVRYGKLMDSEYKYITWKKKSYFSRETRPCCR